MKSFFENWNYKYSLHLAGLITLLSYSLLSWESNQQGIVPLEKFLLFIAIPWIGLIALFLKSKEINKIIKPSFLKIVIVWAILFRIAGLLAEPIYEDDYFRFLWDGYRFAETGDPYSETPMSHFDNREISSELSDVLNGINHPDLPTIYGPILEYLFLISYYLSPAKLWGLKILFILAEAGMLFILFKLLNPRNFLLAAWCPLLVIETSFQAHPDIVGVSLLTCGLYASLKEKSYRSMIFVGLAISTKVFAILALPFWLRKKIFFKQGILAGLVILTCYIPFLLQGSNTGLTSLQTMAEEWEFNAGPYALIKIATSVEAARYLWLGIFALIYTSILFHYWKRPKNFGKEAPLDIIYGSFFLLSPVINPWYLLWMIPFIMLRPKPWSISALIVVSLSYITGANLQGSILGNQGSLENFDNPLSVKLLEFGIIAFAILANSNYCAYLAEFKKRTSTK